MAIRFRCPNCNQLMSIGSRMAGERVRCPGCDDEIVVPTEETAAPPPVGEADAEAAVDEGEASRESADAGAIQQPAVVEPQLSGREARASRGEEDEGGFALRKPQIDSDEMDLTPMVDMTFLLLIFFMVTASFSVHKTIQVPAPDPEQQKAARAIQTLDELLRASIDVEIDERDSISIDGETLANPADLIDTLRERMRSEQKTELLLRASENARHEVVVSVIDAANAVGMQRIRMAVAAGGEGD
jgi:biopolymer transport protein ExbD